MKYGVCIFPTPEIQNFANNYRKRYDPHYALIPPHLTLKDTFDLEESKIQELVDRLAAIARQFQPFVLKVYKINHFHPNSNTIFLALREEPAIVALHEALHHPPLDHERQFSFVPHITIGQNMSNDELHDVFSRLKMRKVSYSFEVDRFHLVYQLENHSWSVQDTFLLGKE